MAFYKAIKEGWDGRKIIKQGEVFKFDGPKGSWMVECDTAGNVKEGEKYSGPARDVRAGASQPKAATRAELREQLKAAGVKFPATMGAVDLANLLREHQEAALQPKKETELPEGSVSGVGNQDVI